MCTSCRTRPQANRLERAYTHSLLARAAKDWMSCVDDERTHLIAALGTQAHQRRHLPGSSVALNLVEVAAEQDAGRGQADQQCGQRQLRPQAGVLQQPCRPRLCTVQRGHERCCKTGCWLRTDIAPTALADAGRKWHWICLHCSLGVATSRPSSATQRRVRLIQS